MKGRKPLPSNIKVLRGTDQPCRMNPNEPKPATDAIKMPPGLGASAKKQWKTFKKQLEDAGILTNIDTQALGVLCTVYARWLEANEKLEEEGPVVFSSTGFPMQSPYLQISNKAFDQLKAMMTEFGITPSSRTRVNAAKPKGPSEFDDL